MGTANAKRNRARNKNKGRHGKQSMYTTPPQDNNEDRGRMRSSEILMSRNIAASPFIDGDLFQQEVSIRSKQMKPMNPINRLKARMEHMKVQRILNDDPKTQSVPGGAPIDRSAHAITARRKQYKVTARARRGNLMSRLLCQVNPDDFSYTPSGGMVRYINWTFRSSFTIVFTSFVLIFFLLVFMFGILLMFAGNDQPQCIRTGGEDFPRETSLYDGFALSWTTFTTVGYGGVYTATGNDHEDQRSCLLITMLSTAESFIGLLYAGICTAIMFAKIGRIQSHAQVMFSDCVCIEYGKERDIVQWDIMKDIARIQEANDRAIPSIREVDEDHLDHDDASSEGDHDGDDNSDSGDDSGFLSKYVQKPKPPQVPVLQKRKIQCPVIKFQLINELCNQYGGEILDATMNVMVRKEKESYPYEPIARFLRVNLEEPSHPFFNRVWHGRHILNEDSPLVSIDARKMIRSNKGYWPEELNNPTAVREHLRFSSLIITMTGISNVSAESVQIAKRYYHHDVVIGYDFAPMLYKDEGSERLKVDMSLSNDVIEQTHTFAEVLTDHEVTRPSLRQHELPIP